MDYRELANPRERAKEYLWHYFRVAGVPENHEIRADIEGIVDLIIEAAKEAMDPPGRG